VKKVRSIIIWTLVAVVGAAGWAVLALSRGENVNAVWLVCAALGSYAIAYRFYARFICRKVLGVDDNRATPAERLDNGIDYQPTDRRILFGHHFAAIAGAGPLVGPVLAAQMGPARHHLDHRGRDLRRRRAGHGHPLLLHAPQRPQPRPDGP